MGKIIKHPAFRKRPGGARRMDEDEKAAMDCQLGRPCSYPNCTAKADRVIGRRSTLLCEEHYQKLRNAKP
jgi:hypothetical protein